MDTLSRSIAIGLLSLNLIAACSKTTRNGTVADASAVSDATLDADNDASISDSADLQEISGPPCVLQYGFEGVTVSNSPRSLALTPTVTNISDTEVSFDLADTCPNGVAVFAVDGLPASYDYYNSCAAGACMASPPTTVTLQPGETRAFSSVTIMLDGDSCNQPTAPNTKLTPSFGLAFSGNAPVTCGPPLASYTIAP